MIDSVPSPADATASYAWPAGRRLANDLAVLAVVAGKQVLDLGCGTGVCGLAALHLGAAPVTFADADATALAGLAGHATIVHTWGIPVPGGPWPVILGGDLLYRPQFFGALLTTIAGSLTHDGLALLSDPRSQLEPGLPVLARQHGLSWVQERRADYTLVSVARLDAQRSAR